MRTVTCEDCGRPLKNLAARRCDPACKKSRDPRAVCVWYLSKILNEPADDHEWRGSYELSSALASVSCNQVYMTPAEVESFLVSLDGLELVERREGDRYPGGYWRRRRPEYRTTPSSENG
jgi:hypothetical protein